jgi:hypothetical protein
MVRASGRPAIIPIKPAVDDSSDDEDRRINEDADGKRQ